MRTRGCKIAEGVLAREAGKYEEKVKEVEIKMGKGNIKAKRNTRREKKEREAKGRRKKSKINP